MGRCQPVRPWMGSASVLMMDPKAATVGGSAARRHCRLMDGRILNPKCGIKREKNIYRVFHPRSVIVYWPIRYTLIFYTDQVWRVKEVVCLDSEI